MRVDVEFKRAFKKAVMSMLDFMKNHSKPEIIYHLAPEVDLGRRRWYLKLKTNVTYYPRIVAFYDQLLKLEDLRKCLDLMLTKGFPERLEMRIVDNEGKPVQNPDYRGFLLAEIFGWFANNFEKYGFEFIEEEFERMYDELVEYVFTPHREVVVVTPLVGFSLHGTDEILVGEYKVRMLTEWEIVQLIEHGYKLGFVWSYDFGDIETIWCVERIIKTPKRSIPPLEPYVKDFITCLRLLKPGIVYHGPILYYPKVWKTLWGMSFSGHEYGPRGASYTLKRDDIQVLTSLLEQFNKAKDKLPNNVRFALRWFNKSYEESERVDRVLDLAIALEVLFGVSDRLDLYVPHFLATNKEDRLKLSDTIRDLRKIRSAIVHSGYYEVSSAFINTIEDVFRQSMRKFLKLLVNQSYEEIIGEIRSSIME